MTSKASEKIKGNSIAVLRSDLAKEWHPTANKPYVPQNVALHSNKKYIWLCSNGHEYEASPDKRARGTGCPYCAGRKLLVGFNDLKSKYPEIAEEWDHERNETEPEDVTFKSSARVNWICSKCSDRWNTPIRNRTMHKKSGCPECAKKNRGAKRHKAALEKTGGITDDKLLKEWDYEKNDKLPSEITKGSSELVNWICSVCGYEYKARVGNRTILNRGCPCCANKVVVKGVNDLATTHPNLAEEWNYEKNQGLSPEEVVYGTSRKVWWCCPQGHSYKASILHRASGGTNCPVCNSGRQTSFAEQAVYFYVKKLYADAINRYNDIFEKGMELDIYIPSVKLGIEYDGAAWHKKDKRNRELKKYNICKENGIRLLRLKEEIDGSCRDTADYFIQQDNMFEHKNLQNTIKLVLDNIDKEINFWTRKNPYKFHSDIDVDIKRDEMEIRKYMTVIKEDSLADMYPEIAKEWHPYLNGSVTASMVKAKSDVKYYWLCPDCGNEYMASPGHRTDGTGCPKCGILKSALARSIEVVMIEPETKEIIETFKSISDATRQTGISSSNITSVCKGNRKRAGGYLWTYKKDLEK